MHITITKHSTYAINKAKNTWQDDAIEINTFRFVIFSFPTRIRAFHKTLEGYSV